VTVSKYGGSIDLEAGAQRPNFDFKDGGRAIAGRALRRKASYGLNDSHSRKEVRSFFSGPAAVNRKKNDQYFGAMDSIKQDVGESGRTPNPSLPPLLQIIHIPVQEVADGRGLWPQPKQSLRVGYGGF
jgi:hypothetical protein